MIVPKGTVWQVLRSSCLDSIPATARVSFARPHPINNWRRDGFYTVANSSRNKLLLITPDSEVGAALLSDSELLLDNAAEHHASLFTIASRGDWFSPGWAIVTIYYWAFFASLALTRLLGRTVWFLDRNAVRDFKKLAPVQNQMLGAGAFRLDCGQYVSATDREVLLQRDDARLHDAVWRRLMRYIAAVTKEHGSESANPLEYRLFSVISSAATKFGEDWPSVVRNAVNYRPGCGYREVIRKTQIDILRYLKKTDHFTAEKLVDEFENHVLITSQHSNPGDDPASLSRLLLLLTLLLQGIVTALHEELIERQSLDSRWSSLRAGFLQRNGLVLGGVLWPY